MSVKISNEEKVDLYLGRRIGKLEVIKTTDRMITFLCSCGNAFDRSRNSAELKPPMTCKECHKLDVSAMNNNRASYNKRHENMTRSNTPSEDAMIKAFMAKQKKAS